MKKINAFLFGMILGISIMGAITVYSKKEPVQKQEKSFSILTEDTISNGSYQSERISSYDGFNK